VHAGDRDGCRPHSWSLTVDWPGRPTRASVGRMTREPMREDVASWRRHWWWCGWHRLGRRWTREAEEMVESSAGCGGGAMDPPGDAEESGLHAWGHPTKEEQASWGPKMSRGGCRRRARRWATGAIYGGGSGWTLRRCY
jgi:hypothetical protein